MGRKSRRVRLEVDRGRGNLTSKKAKLTPTKDFLERMAERAGLRELGRMAKQMPGMHHRTVEANQVLPESAAQPLGHPLKARPAPDAQTGAKPLSARQKDARSKTRHEAMAASPQTELQDSHALTRSETTWNRVNDLLSETVGDVDRLPRRAQALVRRVDSFIRRYERRNDREHLLYANLQLPSSVNHSNIEGFLRKRAEPGSVQDFDRFTMATHQAHEAYDNATDPREPRVMVRMRTRRGAYLGQSGRKDYTGHIVPRGVQMVITDARQETFTRPDGTTETVWVVDMTDAPDMTIENQE